MSYKLGARYACACIAFVFCFSILSACKNNPSPASKLSSTPVATAPVTAPTSTVATTTSTTSSLSTHSVQINGKSETVITNAAGYTLYYYSADTSTKVNCTAACTVVWPAVVTHGSLSSNVAGLPGKVSTISGPNGNQVEYNGHPLYVYTNDLKPGQALGNNYISNYKAAGYGPGGTWHVATPNMPSA